MMQPGDVIATRYQLVRELKSSWLAVDQISGQDCLMKPRASFVDPLAAALLEKVWHSGLPRLIAHVRLDHERDEGKKNLEYLVFEYRKGRSLLEMAASRNGRISIADILPLAGQAAGILTYLHQQGDHPLLHLDIKPDHLIVDEDGQVSLIDFGASRFYGSPDTSGKGGMTGAAGTNTCRSRFGQTGLPMALTPEYAAPEQLAGCPCPASDIFALALTLLQLISGQPADVCRCQPPHELIRGPEAPTGLISLISHCLLADPSSRLNDAQELHERLSAEIGGEILVPPAYPVSFHVKSVKHQERMDAPHVEKSAGIIYEERPAGKMASAYDIRTPLICVWGNPEFGCELAGVLAENRKVLVIDADLLNPQADLLLGCKTVMRPETSEYQLQGLDLALSEERRSHLDASALSRMVQPTRIDRVSVLANRASLDHYEYYDLDSLEKILRLSRIISEWVIVLCSRFIFDAFTSLCLLTSDRVLVPRNGNSGTFRECGRSLQILLTRHKLDVRNFFYVAFDYRTDADLSPGTLNELCDGRLIGHISIHDKRRSMKCGALPYAADLDRVNRNEYKAIIRRMHMLGGHRDEKLKGIG
jgi:hypothetical protein